MLELRSHPVYKLLELDFKDIVVDYVVLQNDTDQHGYPQHKEAAIKAMSIIAKRIDDYFFYEILTDSFYENNKREDFFSIHWDEETLTATPYSVEQFFSKQKNNCRYGKYKGDGSHFCESDSKACGAEYALSFMEPPHGYHVESDWERLNTVLFSGPENLEIYKWSTDWSNYFEAGLEWWGAYYWTVYDKQTNLFIVVGASTTD